MTDDTKDPMDEAQGTRRDFLGLTVASFGAVGAVMAVSPFVNTLSPAKDTMALSIVEVDLSPIEVGQSITVMWQGKPVFIRRRTADEIKAAQDGDKDIQIDKELDKDRVKEAQWLILVGICTHLGCVPTGQKTTDSRGDYDGWLCPCHGSHYDTSGRIRKGPAPKNLAVPPYEFKSDTLIKIG